MNFLFAPFLRKFVLMFMNDILIHNSSVAEHVEHIRQVFQVMQDNKLFIKFSKCAFAQF
jgi:Mg2+ and Co2+ transporter CorA